MNAKSFRDPFLKDVLASIVDDDGVQTIARSRSFWEHGKEILICSNIVFDRTVDEVRLLSQVMDHAEEEIKIVRDVAAKMGGYIPILPKSIAHHEAVESALIDPQRLIDLAVRDPMSAVGLVQDKKTGREFRVAAFSPTQHITDALKSILGMDTRPGIPKAAIERAEEQAERERVEMEAENRQFAGAMELKEASKSKKNTASL